MEGYADPHGGGIGQRDEVAELRAGRIPPSVRRALWAGVAGNVIEWYDFAVYGYLATTMAAVFFPGDDQVAALLSTFAVFALAYFARPLGAFLLGAVGDRLGRRTALSLAILGMGFSTAAIGLIPSYATIGLAAPLLLVLARLVQGISVGGEFGGASTFVVEYAPSRRRGWMGGLLQTSTAAGLLLGATMGALLTNLLGQQQLVAWGWRIAFLIALPMCAIGFYLRVKVEDPPQFRRLRQQQTVSRTPIRDMGREHWRAFLTGIGLLIGWLFAGGIVLIYLPTWLDSVRAMTQGQSLVLTFVGLACYVAFIPVTGYLSDRFGRRPVMIVALVGMAAAAYPGFILLRDAPFGIAFLGYLLLLWFVALFGGPVPAILAELFPTAVRTSGVAIAYALTVAIFQGNAPLAATWILETTGYTLVPAAAIVLLAVPSLLVALKTRETSKLELA